ncbi:MAG: D-alanine--D-alanine ligase, partial [Phycisphaerales bacterium]|nr:D-alanine--D-alanine ligase [Phycisphaerales bacterium]
LVLMGGPDAERDVSLQSGAAVARALRAVGDFTVRECIIDRPDLEQLRTLVGTETDVVFPVLHGTWGEGGDLQALLERLGVAFVGSTSSVARIAMDKLDTKFRLDAHGVRSPRATLLGPDDPCTIEPPLVLKPNNDGSSVDLRICHSVDDVNAGRSELHPKRHRLLAESFIRGREVTVGILGDRALPLIEIVPATTFYDYAAKYERDDTTYRIDPDDIACTDLCAAWALKAFRELGCRDLGRVDFMVDDSGPWFLEINTMPGFTDHSLVPMAARAIGIEMPELCRSLVTMARLRAESAPMSSAAATTCR